MWGGDGGERFMIIKAKEVDSRETRANEILTFHCQEVCDAIVNP